jgi:hypothetical protein
VWETVVTDDIKKLHTDIANWEWTAAYQMGVIARLLDALFPGDAKSQQKFLGDIHKRLQTHLHQQTQS